MSIATRPWAAALSASAAGQSGATILRDVSILATSLVLASAVAPAQITIGHSVEGRPIVAERIGSATAKTKLMVVGSIHGNEPAGKAVVARLRRAHPPRGTALWLIDDANPDGAAANSRHNAHDVDLNRNFPYRWQPQDGVYESGPGPASEPETQAIERFVERERPRVTLWYHQALHIVVKSAGDAKLQRLYSRLSGLKRRSLTAYHGTVSSWQNSTFPGDTAFVVELPAGPLPAAGVAATRARCSRWHGRSRRRGWCSGRSPSARSARPTCATTPTATTASTTTGCADPRVIVEHYTVTQDFQPVYNTFAPNRPDPELGELPGICAHFVVDRDGTIYQLVSHDIMCRHTVGLNYTAIGIEHVGRSDAQVLGDTARWRPRCAHALLRGRYGIRRAT